MKTQEQIEALLTGFLEDRGLDPDLATTQAAVISVLCWVLDTKQEDFLGDRQSFESIANTLSSPHPED